MPTRPRLGWATHLVPGQFVILSEVLTQEKKDREGQAVVGARL